MSVTDEVNADSQGQRQLLNRFTVQRVRIIDSHTGGEPTRLVLSGGPDLGSGAVAERLKRFRSDYDWFRSAVVNEPRGSDVIVGALLCEPSDRSCATGVIFFNNVGYLGMCGHGTIGIVVTLAHMGRIMSGAHRIETPVGTVATTLHESGEVTVENVPSYRTARQARVEVLAIVLRRGLLDLHPQVFDPANEIVSELHTLTHNTNAADEYEYKVWPTEADQELFRKIMSARSRDEVLGHLGMEPPRQGRQLKTKTTGMDGAYFFFHEAICSIHSPRGRNSISGSSNSRFLRASPSTPSVVGTFLPICSGAM